ncbi:MAG TPA: hypothetical protein DCR93_01570 [Cytophagales bacterium]|nr:hypothetical protein [Cytophagales bacterium]HAP58241.1 hypothetical protein [Cytophagales bacterium]
MKYYHLSTAIILFLVLSLSITANGQDIQWGISAGAFGEDFIEDLAYDMEGNVLVAGSFSDNVVWGDSTFNSGGFVSKLSPDGLVQWTHVWGGSSDGGLAVCADSDGNVYVAGSFSGSNFSYAGFTFSRWGGGTFVMKISPWGEVQFVKDMGRWWPSDIKAMPNGGYLLAGRTRFDVTIDDSTYAVRGRSGLYDMFMVKGNAQGTVDWVRNPGSTTDEEITSIDVHETGIYVGGFYTGASLDFGEYTHMRGDESRPGVIFKYSLAGDFEWLKEVHQNMATATVHGIAVSRQGDLYVSGWFRDGNLRVESGFFLSKHDANGSLQLLRKYYSNYERRHWMAISAGDDAAYLTMPVGILHGGDPLPIPNGNYPYRAFMLKFNEVLHPQYALLASGGDSNSDYGNALEVQHNRVLWGGRFNSDTLSLGDLQFLDNSGNRSYDFFIVSSEDTTKNKCPDYSTLAYGETPSIVCQGDQFQLSVNASAYAHTIQWYRNDSPVASTQANTITVSSEGTYRARINNGTSCSFDMPDVRIETGPSPSDSADIIIKPSPTALVSVPDPMCTENAYVISAEEKVGYQYTWNIPGSLTEEGHDGPQAQVLWTEPSQKTGTLLLVDGESGCQSEQSFVFQVGLLPNSELNDIQFVCLGDTATLRAKYEPDWWYTWQGEGLVQSMEEEAHWVSFSTDSIPLLLHIQDTASGCENTDTLLISAREAVAEVLSFSEDTVALCSGEVLSVEAIYDPNWRYQWQTSLSIRGDSNLVEIWNASQEGSILKLIVSEIYSGCTDERIYTIKESVIPEVWLDQTEDSLVLTSTTVFNTIRWFVDSTELSEFAGLTRIQPEGIGDFYAMVYSAEGCAAQTEVISIDEPLSLFGQTKKMRVFPNPATSRITIETEQTPESIVVLSLTGQVMTSSQGKRTLDLRGMAPGVYLLQVQFEDHIHYQRISKK